MQLIVLFQTKVKEPFERKKLAIYEIAGKSEAIVKKVDIYRYIREVSRDWGYLAFVECTYNEEEFIKLLRKYGYKVFVNNASEKGGE